MTTTLAPPDDGHHSEGQATQRARWATRKMTVKSSKTKRNSLLNRMQHRKAGSNEKNVPSDDPEPPFEDMQPDQNNNPDDDENDDEEEDKDDQVDNRTLYFNQPLPEQLLDEDGHPSQTFTRNKIRTAKYTPVSFVPKNLWFQFHNVANIFFLFLVILVVSKQSPLALISQVNLNPFIDLSHFQQWRKSWPQRSTPNLHRRGDRYQRCDRGLSKNGSRHRAQQCPSSSITEVDQCQCAGR